MKDTENKIRLRREADEKQKELRKTGEESGRNERKMYQRRRKENQRKETQKRESEKGDTQTRNRKERREMRDDRGKMRNNASKTQKTR